MTNIYRSPGCSKRPNTSAASSTMKRTLSSSTLDKNACLPRTNLRGIRKPCFSCPPPPATTTLPREFPPYRTSDTLPPENGVPAPPPPLKPAESPTFTNRYSPGVTLIVADRGPYSSLLMRPLRPTQPALVIFLLALEYLFGYCFKGTHDNT